MSAPVVIDILRKVFDSVANRLKVDAALSGSTTQQTQIVASQAVAAGATYYAAYENLSAYTTVAFSGNAEASSDWTLFAAGSPDGVTFGTYITSSSGVALGKSIEMRVRLNYMRVEIKNNDTVGHTYNVWRRAMAAV